MPLDVAMDMINFIKSETIVISFYSILKIFYKISRSLTIVRHRENEKMFEQFRWRKKNSHNINIFEKCPNKNGKIYRRNSLRTFTWPNVRIDVFVGCVWVFVRENDRHEDSSIVQSLTYLRRLSLTSFSQFGILFCVYNHIFFNVFLPQN